MMLLGAELTDDHRPLHGQSHVHASYLFDGTTNGVEYSVCLSSGDRSSSLAAASGCRGIDAASNWWRPWLWLLVLLAFW
jgi:hypothetical protein